MRLEPTCVAELWEDPNFAIMCDEYATYAIKGFLTPKYDRSLYEAIERTGTLAAYRAVEGNELAGFMGILTSMVPHYGLKLSVVESLFVRAIHRKSGVGFRMIKTAEEYATHNGALGIFINCPFAETILQTMLPKLGYVPQTIHYFKPLCPSLLSNQ